MWVWKITQDIVATSVNRIAHFFNVLKSGNPVHKYDIHAPSIPDMCGDVMMVIVITIAYLFTILPKEEIIVKIFFKMTKIDYVIMERIFRFR